MANVVGYVLRSLWLAAFAVVLLLRRRATTAVGDAATAGALR